MCVYGFRVNNIELSSGHRFLLVAEGEIGAGKEFSLEMMANSLGTSAFLLLTDSLLSCLC